MSIPAIIETGLGVGLGIFLGTASWALAQWIQKKIDVKIKQRRFNRDARKLAIESSRREDRQGRQNPASWIDPDTVNAGMNTNRRH